MSLSLAMRPYQTEATEAVHKAEAERQIQRPLISLPTGTGKTVVFCHLIAQRGGPALVVAHRDELLTQAQAKLAAIMPDTSIGIVKAERDELHAQVLVASIQTISRDARLERLMKGEPFNTIVIDEAHHAAAESYEKVMRALGSFDRGGPLTLGVTATPMRGDKIGLAETFEEIVYSREILEMIAEGWLCDLTAKRVQLAVDFTGLKVSRGDFQQGQAGAMMMDAEAPHQIANAWTEYATDRKGLVFTPTVAVAKAVADEFRSRGFRAESVDADTPTDERRGIISRLSSGQTQIVANCGVLTEGFDDSSIDCIAIARPTKSKTLYIQMVGRGTRRHPGKENCLILDLVGNTIRHDIFTLNELFGLTRKELKDKTVLEAVEDRQETAEAISIDGRMIAVDVDLTERKVSWVDAGAGNFGLSIEGGTLLLDQRADGVAVMLCARDKDAVELFVGPTVEEAFGFAEAHAAKSGSAHLIDRGASWRDDPATPKQIAALERWRLPVHEGLTKGQAGDLLSAAVAKRDAWKMRQGA